MKTICKKYNTSKKLVDAKVDDRPKSDAKYIHTSNK